MDIELLIKRFYDGVSTPEEERLLSEFFLNEEIVDEHLKNDQQVFRFLNDSQIKIPEGVSERLEKSIMQMDVSQKSQTLKRQLHYWISSAAAVTLLCIGLFFFFFRPSPPKLVDTFSNPEEAALVAEQSITFMSMQLNKGLNKVSDAEQEIEKANQLLNNILNF
jgi:hypothetical protein